MGWCAGVNVKLARQGKSSVLGPASVGDGGEEAGPGATMGLLKRKWTTPPELAAPNKRRTLEDAELRISCSSEPVVGGTQTKNQAGRSFSPSQDAAATRVKQPSVQGNNESTMSELAPEEAARLRFENDVDALQSRAPSFVENVSHGQGTSSSQAGSPPETSGPAVTSMKECEAQSPATPHLVPSHAGWFQWAKVHQLEKVTLPEFFSTKEDTKQTPETYMEHRSRMMKKYRENPQKLMKFEDVRELLTGNVSGAVRLFGFLDHWGLINYQAVTGFPPSSSSRRLVRSAEDTNSGAVTLNPLVKPALVNLFNFEAAAAPAQKLVSISPSPASNLPISSLAEAAVQESLAAPAVDYHCNSCQADCSKRRYHCQKQADFDLCPDCYSDGKFGQGMTGTDFLRMDALTGNADVTGGGWSDQETLLLLEALELYGDNWNEIAEHVATKSKAQCILHFIRLPIEDPFLEDMESSNSVVTVQSYGKVAYCRRSTSPPTDIGAQAKAAKDEDPSSIECMEVVPSIAEPKEDPSGPKEKAKKDGEPSSPREAEEQEKDGSDVSEVIKKANDSKDVHPLLAIAESAGCAGGPDGLVAFVDAGNPVMTQVAFLAAMVGPRIAAAAAQAALKSLAEDDPVGFLSAKNSFALDGSDSSGKTLASASLESGHRAIETQFVSSSGFATVSCHEKATSKPTEEAAARENVNEKVLVEVTLEKASGQEAPPSQKLPVRAPTSSQIVAEQDVPSVAKVRTAAANALASAAVKAKLLADQEEREIQRLVAGVIENQLKKLELKLKHFSELESLLGKECEQAEKARAKVYAERARIVASRLGSPPSIAQLQSTGSTAASYPKISAHPTNSIAQPKPAAFKSGPAAVSAPSAVASMTTSALESSSSLPASSSTQQEATPQRLLRPVPRTGLAIGAQE